MSDTMTEQKARQQLLQAHELYAAKRFSEAQRLYESVLLLLPNQADALQSLVAIALQTARPQEAEQYLGRLTQAYPRESSFAGHYANALASRGAVDEAIACYEQLLTHEPVPAEARHSYGLLLRRVGKDEAALTQYERALVDQISDPEQVYSNISVLHSDAGRIELAEQALLQALSLNAQHVPALYNLALLKEETGLSVEAIALFERILETQPGHAGALARIAHGQRVTDPSARIIERMQQALANTRLPPIEREELLFAAGKVADDLGQFEQAMGCYRQANALSRQRVSGYEPMAQAQLTEDLIKTADRWPAPASRPGKVAPIFVCGMFRSGSTLLEQMLAAHPQVTAGGEIPYFVSRWPLPEAFAQLTPERIDGSVEDYLHVLRKRFPGVDPGTITNKQPNNLHYLGAICQAFPDARILVTERQPLDNCLAVYFQPLSEQLSYANDLQHIGHYYLQQQRLLAAWQQRYPDNILVVQYEELVTKPKETLLPALAHLGMPWNDQCLKFNELKNRVRTASVWQVRQPLHSDSVNRWRNYEDALAPLREVLEEGGALPQH